MTTAEASTNPTQFTFRICLGCDKSIPARRLQIVPWAAYCVSCQEQVDGFAREHSSDGHLVMTEE